MTTQTTLPITGSQWVYLEEICQFKRGPFGGSLKKDIFINHGYKVYEQQHAIQNNFNLGDYYISEEKYLEMQVFAIKPNDLLVSCSGTMGKVAIVPPNAKPGIINQALLKLTPNLDAVFPPFLKAYLQSEEVQRKYFRVTTGTAIQNVAPVSELKKIKILLPLLEDQKRIAAALNAHMESVAQARKAAEEQLELLNDLIKAFLRKSLATSITKKKLSECFIEVKKGVGETWKDYPVIGATRAGVAPAKEKVGKQPQRYKLVEAGTILYNPMRINIGSIAMLDDGDTPGITSPDYVVIKTKEGVIHPRWFYFWLRSMYGEEFIKTLARGAVRERMLFNRLANGEIELPPYDIQCQVAEKFREINILKKSIEAQLAEIKHLPSALLRRAFAGKL